MMTPKIHVLIPAAGSGQRFGGDRAKQYSSFLDGILIDHSINQLETLVSPSNLIVGLAEADPFWVDTLSSKSARVKRVEGGATRAQTVFNMLGALGELDSDDWVLIHDAVRPCIDRASLQPLLACLGSTQASGVSLGRPVHEAVKRVAEVPVKAQGSLSAEGSSMAQGCSVLSSESREGLWLTQTPQVFRYSALLQSMQLCMDQCLSFDDEMMALHHSGFATEMVVGPAFNIKITTRDDLSLAENYWKIMQANSAGKSL